jgi:hypothetical protein
MLLITHIIIALASLVYAGFTFTSPGEFKKQVEQQGVPPEDPSLAIINALIRKLEIYQNEDSNES